MLWSGMLTLIMVSVDNYVDVMVWYAYWYFDVEELWVEFGCGKDCK